MDWPLVTMDYRSCEPEAIYPTDLLDKADDFRGQTVTFGYADDQQWYYSDGHQTDEITLVKIWDNGPNVDAKCELIPLTIFCNHVFLYGYYYSQGRAPSVNLV